MTTIGVNIATEDIIAAVKAMPGTLQKSFLIELLTAVAPEYLNSFEDSRKGYIAGQISNHSDAFGN